MIDLIKQVTIGFNPDIPLAKSPKADECLSKWNKSGLYVFTATGMINHRKRRIAGVLEPSEGYQYMKFLKSLHLEVLEDLTHNKLDADGYGIQCVELYERFVPNIYKEELPDFKLWIPDFQSNFDLLLEKTQGETQAFKEKSLENVLKFIYKLEAYASRLRHKDYSV